MAQPHPAETGHNPQPSGEQVFALIRETRQTLRIVEHRFPSFGENSHQDELRAATAKLDAGQRDSILKGRRLLIDEGGRLEQLEGRLKAWQKEEGSRVLKVLLTEAYTAEQTTRIMELLQDKEVTVRDRGLRQSPAIVLMSNGRSAEEATGLVRHVDPITGHLRIQSRGEAFEAGSHQWWSVDAIDINGDTELVDLAIH